MIENRIATSVAFANPVAPPPIRKIPFWHWKSAISAPRRGAGAKARPNSMSQQTLIGRLSCIPK